MTLSAFFTLHSNLPREGPGEPADIAWVGAQLDLPEGARILDAACGPGADIPALLQLSPKAQVTAFDRHAPFVETARDRHGQTPGVTVVEGDLATPPGGPYDLIWCAGAVYFIGIEAALTAWRPLLSDGGAIAFSEPVFFTETPSEAAVAFWDGHPTKTEAGIRDQIAAAGFKTRASRPLGDAAWTAYYDPLDARSAQLEGDPALSEVLAEARQESSTWRAHRAETGYLLSVVLPA